MMLNLERGSRKVAFVALSFFHFCQMMKQKCPKRQRVYDQIADYYSSLWRAQHKNNVFMNLLSIIMAQSNWENLCSGSKPAAVGLVKCNCS